MGELVSHSRARRASSIRFAVVPLAVAGLIVGCGSSDNSSSSSTPASAESSGQEDLLRVTAEKFYDLLETGNGPAAYDYLSDECKADSYTSPAVYQKFVDQVAEGDVDGNPWVYTVHKVEVDGDKGVVTAGVNDDSGFANTANWSKHGDSWLSDCQIPGDSIAITDIK